MMGGHGKDENESRHVPRNSGGRFAVLADHRIFGFVWYGILWKSAMTTKNETAQLLAEAHFRLDQGITRIFRIVEPDESSNLRPVKLLEVTPMTTEAGIQPVGLSADPARRIFHSSVIVEISPHEFERLTRGELHLPHDWRLGDELFPHASAAAGAAS
jgi:hypothetical protein